jgi:hypothetical protein
MGKFNIITFRKETEKVRSSPALVTLARNAAMARFLSAKEDAISEFDNHPVTQELLNGPESNENLSNTLGGRGNLYSFIGFPEGEEPTKVVRDALIDGLQVEKTPEIETKITRTNFKFRVLTPDMADLEALTPMPWESGLSWLRGIERGISGLGHYIYWKLDILNKYPNGSRSGAGLQVDNLLRTISFRPVSYISEILGRFLSRFSKR